MRVIVVEDERRVREELVELFGLRGIAVKAVDSVQAALKALHALHSPVMLLTDLRLSDGSGLDIIREIQRNEKLASKIFETIVMTGHTDITEQMRKSLEEAGATILFKPVDIQMLLAMLGRAPQ
ncbi:response regulator [Sphingomonas sp. 37zxx]|uniref:response regulator n=1 Tax=Sphingomonas sp. 37zxx TaxID=1550073 RepID=UPI00053BEDB5|nr:response regulator [Sphingomonas sp. 37zxx]